MVRRNLTCKDNTKTQVAELYTLYKLISWMKTCQFAWPRSTKLYRPFFYLQVNSINSPLPPPLSFPPPDKNTSTAMPSFGLYTDLAQPTYFSFFSCLCASRASCAAFLLYGWITFFSCFPPWVFRNLGWKGTRCGTALREGSGPRHGQSRPGLPPFPPRPSPPPGPPTGGEGAASSTQWRFTAVNGPRRLLPPFRARAAGCHGLSRAAAGGKSRERRLRSPPPLPATLRRGGTTSNRPTSLSPIPTIPPHAP